MAKKSNRTCGQDVEDFDLIRHSIRLEIDLLYEL